MQTNQSMAKAILGSEEYKLFVGCDFRYKSNGQPPKSSRLRLEKAHRNTRLQA
jgi:hypothetical protein